MLNRYSSTALALSTAALLTACGGNGDSNGEGSTNMDTRLPPADPEMRTGGQQLADGETLTAHHMAAAMVEGGLVRQIQWEDVNVTRSGEESYTLVVDGITYELVHEDDPYNSDFSNLDLEALDPEGGWYASARLRYSEPDYRDEHYIIIRHSSDGPDWRGYAIAGNRSHQVDSNRMGTATYGQSVSAYMELYDSGIPTIWSRNRTAYWSNEGRVTADFDAGTVSAQFDEWRTDGLERDENGNWPGIDITMTFEAAPITSDGFTGDVTFEGSDLDADDQFDVAYEGSFYGPDAEDVAGVMSGTYQSGTGRPDQVIGYFGARRDDQ